MRNVYLELDLTMEVRNIINAECEMRNRGGVLPEG
jgi:hypothetical protein